MPRHLVPHRPLDRPLGGAGEAGEAGEAGGCPSFLEPAGEPDARISAALREGLGILRDQESLERCLGQLEAAGEKAQGIQGARALFAQAACLSALARKESRGAHWRSDYPEEQDEFAQVSLVKRGEDGLSVTFCEPAAMGEGIR